MSQLGGGASAEDRAAARGAHIGRPCCSEVPSPKVRAGGRGGGVPRGRIGSGGPIPGHRRPERALHTAPHSLPHAGLQVPEKYLTRKAEAPHQARPPTGLQGAAGAAGGAGVQAQTIPGAHGTTAQPRLPGSGCEPPASAPRPPGLTAPQMDAHTPPLQQMLNGTQGHLRHRLHTY